jgi:hypothetical protein
VRIGASRLSIVRGFAVHLRTIEPVSKVTPADVLRCDDARRLRVADAKLNSDNSCPDDAS